MKELYLYGEVLGNRDPWYDELKVSYICPENVQERLDAFAGEDLTVYMNTHGGDVYAGITVRHMLERYPGHVTAVIDGIGASAGSLILMGADEVRMHNDSTFMLHFPWTIAMGNSKDMRTVADRLETLNGLMMTAYKERFTGTDEELRLLLENESELTAEQAMTYGFCDVLVEKTVKNGIAANAQKEGDVFAKTVAPTESPVSETQAENEEAQEDNETHDVPEEEPDAQETETGRDESDEPEPGEDNKVEGKHGLLAVFMHKEQAGVLARFKTQEDERV